MLDIHNAHAWSKKKVAKWRIEPLPPDLQVVVLTTGPWTLRWSTFAKPNPSPATSLEFGLVSWVSSFKNNICGWLLHLRESCLLHVKRNKKQKTNRRKWRDRRCWTHGVWLSWLGCYHCTMKTSKPALKNYVIYGWEKRWKEREGC